MKICYILFALLFCQLASASYRLERTNHAFLKKDHVNILNQLAANHNSSKSKTNTLTYSFFLITWKLTEVHGVWREPIPVGARKDIQNIEVLLQPYLVKNEKDAWPFAFMALYYKYFGSAENITRLPSYKTPNGKDYSYWYRKSARSKLDSLTNQALIRDPKNPLALYLKSLRKLRAPVPDKLATTKSVPC